MTSLVKGCKSVEVVDTSGGIPEGCGSTVLSSYLSVHLLVKVYVYDAKCISHF